MDHVINPSDRYTSHSLVNNTVLICKKYNQIQNYDVLRYHQLRYLFCDHDFLPFQWKAMQLAGWTYSGGIYKSPKGTRTFDNVNKMKEQLDMTVVRPINTLLFPAQNTSGMSSLEIAEYDHEQVEAIVDLRNDICYQMQLLIEKTNETNPPESTSSADMEAYSTNHRPPDPKVNPIISMSEHTAKNKSSVTAAEKGSDLYLHRKRKSVKATSNKEKRLSVSDTSTVNHRIVEGELPSFPPIYRCREVMATWNVEACEAIETRHARHNFARWRFWLSANHSLLLYGNGSKYDLLTKFCEMELSQFGDCLQIDGFDPDVTMDDILDLLVLMFLDGKEPHPNTIMNDSDNSSILKPFHAYTPKFGHNRTTVDRAISIAKALAGHTIVSGSTIFLIIHGLDGNLSNDCDQDALAALVHYSTPICCVNENDICSHTTPSLRLVASIDHVDALAALWSTETTNLFSWIFYEVHTYRPYINELSILSPNENSVEKNGFKTEQRLHKKQSRAIEQAERVLQVLKNLAPRYGEVMQILAQLQMEELKNTSQGWVDYKVFRSACKSRFVIDKDSKLRTLQTELSDHHLLISKSEGSTEYVSIPYSIAKLREIIDFQRGADK